MSWATITAFLSALPAVLKLLQSLANYAEAKSSEKAGRDAAIAEAATMASAQIDLATKARQEADEAHKKDPTDDAFDPDFKR